MDHRVSLSKDANSQNNFHALFDISQREPFLVCRWINLSLMLQANKNLHYFFYLLDYGCSYWRSPIYVQGWLYIFEKHLCWSGIASFGAKVKIPVSEVTGLRKDRALWNMGYSLVVITSAAEVPRLAQFSPDTHHFY